MLAATPVDVALLACTLQPYTTVLYADAAKKAKVNLPPGALVRKCSVPGEGAQVLTAPDSGGTEMCVFYEFSIDPKEPQVQIGKMRTGVGKSLADKKCPALDSTAHSYPGKDYFFLSDNVPLPNAFGVKERVEASGLAFLKQEQLARKDGKPAVDFGNTPFGVEAIAAATTSECRKQSGFFEGRYSACYRVQAYNRSVRKGLTMLVALNKKGDYLIVQSIYKPLVTR